MSDSMLISSTPTHSPRRRANSSAAIMNTIDLDEAAQLDDKPTTTASDSSLLPAHTPPPSTFTATTTTTAITTTTITTTTTSSSSTSESTTVSTATPSSTFSSSSAAATTATTTTTTTTASPSSSSSSSSSLSSSSSSSTATAPQLTRTPSQQANLSRTSTLRLQSDLRALENDTPEGVSASPLHADNVYLWRACIFGPPDTPWEGGVFECQLTFTFEYPSKPPSVRFLSKLFHPNVFADGTLCLDIIQDQWSPVFTVSTILTSIQSLLTDPNPASPANPEAAKLYQTDKKQYNKRVRACVAKCSGC